MTRLFNRRVSLLVRDPDAPTSVLEISGLRVQFKVKKTIGKTPNTAEIVVTNLAQQTRGQIKAKTYVQLLAGYGTSLEQIFAGDARAVSHTHQRPEWLSKFDCGDGERAMQRSRVNESFAPGTKVLNALLTVGKKLGFDTSNAETTLTGEMQDEFVNGYTATGWAASVFDDLLLGKGYEWSIQDGQLQVLKVDNTRAGRITVLTADTGMIGSPEFVVHKKGQPPLLKVKSLLQGYVQPGSRIRVEARHVTGEFKAVAVSHEGDTAGDAFYTEVEARPISS